ncbi:hypothetical protein TIFTF001_048040 [Ficus carica]|uniref:C-JID domain-containing protein n=1 Tax=Ficus carica TaxID=3494 RepID=A0AA87ZD63_FICCA|nr:hypothetical protein TIFTF001_048040 [Ficus carica]
MSQLDEELHLKPEVFQKMNNLRLLKIYSFGVDVKVYINQDLQSLPSSLRYLHWEGYPSKQLPSNFQPQNLFELNLPRSQLEQLFNGVQNLENLKSIDLSNSIHLIQFPDFSNAPNLEKINLKYCKSLTEVPSHCLRNLNKLIDLNLSHCNAIEGLSDGVDLTFLRNLSVRGCSNLKTFPAVINLSISNLNALRMLELSSCKKLECMPPSFGPLYLRRIYLSDCDIREIPETIKGLELKWLHIDNCKNLKFLPELPLTLELISARRCVSLEMVSSTEKAFTQKFWDDYTTDTYDGDGCWDCLFYDCFKLDQNGRQTINTEFQLRVLSLAARPRRPGYMIGRSSVNTCYPGNEIPNWFYNQVEGSSIIIKLPQQWHDIKFLGFVVCAVGDSYIASAKVAGLRCELNFVLINGENRKFSSVFTRDNCPVVQPLLPPVNSDHVYMWYCPPYYNNRLDAVVDYNICLDAVEVTFQFAFDEFNVSREDVDIMKPSKCEVKRCGIRMLYQKDLDEFFSNNEYLLEPPAKKTKKSENITGAISA